MKDPESFAASQPIYALLSPSDQAFWLKVTRDYRLTQSQSRNLMIQLRDIAMWGEASPSESFSAPDSHKNSRQQKEQVLTWIQTYWDNLKTTGQDYSSSIQPNPVQMQKDGENRTHFVEITDDRNILGRCPVASEKTRCCNLYTLDAVFRCGFDCSYCSIQSFYDEGRISFHGNLKEKLKALKLDRNKRYHIGTGQSSDSLMWGNREGLLQNLMDFAEDHKEHLILELKSKSDNVGWLLGNPVPQNVIVTWSLNTPQIIAHEERLTANLDHRLGAARACADKGIALGFHFHPMVRYKNWERDYRNLFQRLKQEFDPSELVLISLGTLTYIKPVLKKIRNRDFLSAILRMPMEEIAGRYSYPFEQKKELFQLVLDELGGWQDQVYFYMCMEDKELWKPLLGRHYTDNDQFEKDMLDHYFQKLKRIHGGSIDHQENLTNR